MKKLFLFSSLIYFSVAGLCFGANTYSIDLENDSFQYLDITDGSQTGLDLVDDFTLEAWINLEQLPSSGDHMTILSKKDISVADLAGYNLIISAGNALSLTYADDFGRTIIATADNIFTGGDVGVWVHIAVSVDVSAKTAIFYKNGIIKTSDSSGTATAVSGNDVDFNIGVSTSGEDLARYFDGKIDEVRVWNDIRTGSEITNNYQTELVGNEAGLVGYWKLNNSFSDETANNNDLTDINSPLFSTDVPFVGEAEPEPPAITGSLFSVPMASSSEMLASVGTLGTDLWILLALAMGVPLGFYITKNFITLTPKAYQKWRER
jgi:hypothetical protein